MANPYFEDRVQVVSESGCWIWMLSIDKDGYGACSVGGKKKRAHRASLEHYKGIKPKCGQVVMHDCDVPSCINPDHLSVGTQSQNIRDSHSRGRSIQAGEDNNGSKLTADIARRIFLSDACHTDIARVLGTTRKNVEFIRRRASWRNATKGLVAPVYKDGRNRNAKR